MRIAPEEQETTILVLIEGMFECGRNKKQKNDNDETGAESNRTMYYLLRNFYGVSKLLFLSSPKLQYSYCTALKLF